MSERAKDLAERFTAFNNEVMEFVESVIMQSAGEHLANMQSATGA